jgi:hypothetical protein
LDETTAFRMESKSGKGFFLKINFPSMRAKIQQTKIAVTKI